jgi:transcriptional regulator with XRE-family HTH domain
MTTPTDIGRRIKELREARGMPKSELARRAKTTRNTLYRIESGRVAPSSPIVEKIARALEVAPGDLYPTAMWRSLVQSPSDDVFSVEGAVRVRLGEVERCVQYALDRAEYYKQRLERGRSKEYATYDGAYNLAVFAVDEFSSFFGWLYNGPAHTLWEAIQNGVELEIEEAYVVLIVKLISSIRMTTSILFENAEKLAETEAQKEKIVAKAREMNDSDVQLMLTTTPRTIDRSGGSAV